MKTPLLDVLGFTLLLLVLSALSQVNQAAPNMAIPPIDWLLAYEPYARMVGSYGAGIIAIWRGLVLFRRWQSRRKHGIDSQIKESDESEDRR